MFAKTTPEHTSTHVCKCLTLFLGPRMHNTYGTMQTKVLQLPNYSEMTYMYMSEQTQSVGYENMNKHC